MEGKTAKKRLNFGTSKQVPNKKRQKLKNENVAYFYPLKIIRERPSVKEIKKDPVQKLLDELDEMDRGIEIQQVSKRRKINPKDEEQDKKNHQVPQGPKKDKTTKISKKPEKTKGEDKDSDKKQVKYFCEKHNVKYMVEQVRKDVRRESMRKFESVDMLNSEMFLERVDSSLTLSQDLFEINERVWVDKMWFKRVFRRNINDSKNAKLDSSNDSTQDCSYTDCQWDDSFYEYVEDTPTDEVWEYVDSCVQI